MKIKRNAQVRELILYGICGALSTVLDIGIFWFLANVVNLHYLVANAIAWVLAVIFSFLANKYYVFESRSFKREVWVKEATEFFGARGLACGIDMGGMYLLVSVMGINKNYAKLIVTFVVIVLNYVLSKFWIFKKESRVQ
jgi:putative flippase GtrA